MRVSCASGVQCSGRWTVDTINLLIADKFRSGHLSQTGDSIFPESVQVPDDRGFEKKTAPLWCSLSPNQFAPNSVRSLNMPHKTLVFDNGAGGLKAGFAGQLRPSHTMPNCTAKIKNQLQVCAT